MTWAGRHPGRSPPPRQEWSDITDIALIGPRHSIVDLPPRSSVTSTLGLVLGSKEKRACADDGNGHWSDLDRMPAVSTRVCIRRANLRFVMVT